MGDLASSSLRYPPPSPQSPQAPRWQPPSARLPPPANPPSPGTADPLLPHLYTHTAAVTVHCSSAWICPRSSLSEDESESNTQIPMSKPPGLTLEAKHSLLTSSLVKPSALSPRSHFSLGVNPSSIVWHRRGGIQATAPALHLFTLHNGSAHFNPHSQPSLVHSTSNFRAKKARIFSLQLNPFEYSLVSHKHNTYKITLRNY